MRSKQITFDRITAPKFAEKDEEEQALDVLAKLGTNLFTSPYDLDIRQVLCDNSIKDMMIEEDTRFIKIINSVLKK